MSNPSSSFRSKTNPSTPFIASSDHVSSIPSSTQPYPSQTMSNQSSHSKQNMHEQYIPQQIKQHQYQHPHTHPHHLHQYPQVNNEGIIQPSHFSTHSQHPHQMPMDLRELLEFAQTSLQEPYPSPTNASLPGIAQRDSNFDWCDLDRLPNNDGPGHVASWAQMFISTTNKASPKPTNVSMHAHPLIWSKFHLALSYHHTFITSYSLNFFFFLFYFISEPIMPFNIAILVL